MAMPARSRRAAAGGAPTPAAALAAGLALLEAVGGLAPCPGEDRNDKTCTFKDPEQEYDYRVCNRLLGPDGRPRILAEEKDWWQWCFHTDTPERWDDVIRANQGDSWCTCALCTSEIIGDVGCENMDIVCDATDVPYIMASPITAWDNLKACLRAKCPEAAAAPAAADVGGVVGEAEAAGAGEAAAVLPAPRAAGVASLVVAIGLLLATAGLAVAAARRASPAAAERRGYGTEQVLLCGAGEADLAAPPAE